MKKKIIKGLILLVKAYLIIFAISLCILITEMLTGSGNTSSGSGSKSESGEGWKLTKWEPTKFNSNK